MKVIARLILAALIVFIAIKGYIYYRLNEQFSHLFGLIEVSTQSQASYQWISTSFDGEIALKKIKFNQPMTGIRFEADAIRFKGPKLLELFDMEDQLMQRKFPEELMMGVDRGVIYLEDIASQSTKTDESSFLGDVEALGCGNVDVFGLSDLLAMGYTTLENNLKLTTYIDQELDSLRFEMTMSIKDMYDLEITGVLDDMKTMMTSPLPSTLEVVYSDRSYVDRRSEYCSQLNEQSREEYIDDYIGLLKNYMIDKKAPLSSEMLASYKKFLTTPNMIKINVTPSMTVSPGQLNLIEMKDIPQTLGMVVSLNGETIAQIIDPSNRTKEKSVVVEEKGKPVVITGFTYKVTRPSSIRNYNDHRIKVVTKEGKEYDGLIVKTTSSYFDIEYKINQGKFTIPIKYNEVKRAEVLR